MSTDGLTLRLDPMRPHFWRGEQLVVGVVVHNRGASPVRVPVPFDPDAGQLRFVSRADPRVELGRASRVAAHEVVLPAGETYETQVCLDRWLAVSAGAHAYEVRWSLADGGVVAERVAFEVVEPEEMALALPPQVHAQAPATFSAVCAVSGAKLGVIFERRFEAHVEYDALYEPAGDVARFAGDGPIAGLVAVKAADAGGKQWVAWRDHEALHARAGFEVDRAAHVAWPAGARVITPAIETRSGELRALGLRGDGPSRELFEMRFAPPVFETEPAEGPDDWDDQVLVAGPASAVVLGALDLGGDVIAATVASAADDDLRVVLITSSEKGAELVIAQVTGGSLSVIAREPLPATPVPDCTLDAYVDAQGETLAAVAVTRADPDRVRTCGVFVARKR
ncbi:MAG: hypothetical protein IT379_23110, partial [Deltaproteobacteria bacterium]|nr:hypothetical protein [Deltaproteobacteria bacterium]